MKTIQRISIFLILSLVLILNCAVFAADEEVCHRDSFFPKIGNCGYDTTHYDLNLAWDDTADTLTGHVVISLNALWDASEITLDFTNIYTISSVTVDGIPAEYKNENEKLTVSGHFVHDSLYKIGVDYSGKNQVSSFVMDDDQKKDLAGKPMCTLLEPIVAHQYYPCNDIPADKATYSIAVTVPSKYIPASIGSLVEIVQADGTSVVPDEKTLADYKPTGDIVTWKYEAKEPLASYLFTVCIGDFEVTQHQEESGTVQTNFVARNFEDKEDINRLFGLQEDMKKCFEHYTGTAYPYQVSGGIVIDQKLYAAIETQSRSLYDEIEHSETIFAHEIGHQWVGDMISLSDWSDVWIKEGWASYAQALWEKCAGRPDGYTDNLRQNYERVVNTGFRKIPAKDYGDRYISDNDKELKAASLTVSQIEEVLPSICDKKIDQEKLNADLSELAAKGPIDGIAFWNMVPKYCDNVIVNVEQINNLRKLFGIEETDSKSEELVGPKETSNNLDSMYGAGAYAGGSLVYYVLNHELGDEVFIKGMQLMLERYKYGTINTQEFIDCFSEAAGRDLTEFLHPWLYYNGNVPDLPEIETNQEASWNSKK